MPIIILIIVLGALKFFEVWKFAVMSWWWVIGLMVVAFIWFEFVEKMLGLDKKKAHNEDELRRKARMQNTFDKNKKK